MIDRPDWSNTFDSRGNEIVPVEAPKEHQALVAEIANSDGPSTGDDSPVVPAVPAKKNISGLPDWDKPRNEAGQFVSKSEAEYRAIWAKEGGADAAIAKVLSVEATILSASPDATALQAHVATLPKDIQLKAADAMRLQTSYGPSGGAQVGAIRQLIVPVTVHSI